MSVAHGKRIRKLAQRAQTFLKPQGEASVMGPLPDFIIVGAQRSGTTFLYHLLTQHPRVLPAAKKELHYFDIHFDKGIEWYRRGFPSMSWKNGQKTITGEATPYYLFHPPVPERIAQVMPRIHLIVLLRNPIERAYSQYHLQVRKGHETLNFEEAIEAEEARLRGEIRGARDAMLEDKRAGSNRQYFSYLARGIYVDQLLRWSKFFDAEQMLMLKSEGFFERPSQTLQLVLDFLGLPAWKPTSSELQKNRNSGGYRAEMDPTTRRWLEKYFESHNRRLYEYLGIDFGW